MGLDAEDYFSYLSVLAGEYIFTRKGKGEEIAKNINNDKDALDKAIGFEKDSIVFYTAIKKIVPGYDLKVIDALIEQEELHLKQLLGMKKII